jgi:ribonuclease HII
MQLSPEQTRWLNQIRAGTSEFIIGVDEVGYGAWAGPITVCAAVVRRGWSHPKVRDSKKVPAARRALLVREVLVYPEVLVHYVVSNPSEVIDHLGLVQARDECIADAIELCLLDYPGSMIVMDGNVVPNRVPKETICLPKADDLVPAVSAASIIAKEHRDGYMHDLHKRWPEYGFDSNVGYGTDTHKAGLAKYGAIPTIHRMSFSPLRGYAHWKPKLWLGV